MKYQKVKSTKNSWTCKCGAFYHNSTPYCIHCPKPLLVRLIEWFKQGDIIK